MGKKYKYKQKVHGNKDTVDARRTMLVEQRLSLDRYYSAKCYDDLYISSPIGGTHHISRIEFGIAGGILLIALVASGMGGDDGSIAGIADNHTTGHPVIKSLTHTDHDIDVSVTTDIRPNSKPDCSANYNIGKFGIWGYHLARCSIKSLSRGS